MCNSWDPGLERDYSPLFRLIAYFNRVAANLTVLDVALEARRRVQQHRDAFTAVGAGKNMLADCQAFFYRCVLFHRLTPLSVG
jgi:hypothetical protein